MDGIRYPSPPISPVRVIASRSSVCSTTPIVLRRRGFAHSSAQVTRPSIGSLTSSQAIDGPRRHGFGTSAMAETVAPTSRCPGSWVAASTCPSSPWQPSLPQRTGTQSASTGSGRSSATRYSTSSQPTHRASASSGSPRWMWPSASPTGCWRGTCSAQPGSIRPGLHRCVRKERGRAWPAHRHEPGVVCQPAGQPLLGRCRRAALRCRLSALVSPDGRVAALQRKGAAQRGEAPVSRRRRQLRGFHLLPPAFGRDGYVRSGDPPCACRKSGRQSCSSRPAPCWRAARGSPAPNLPGSRRTTSVVGVPRRCPSTSLTGSAGHDGSRCTSPSRQERCHRSATTTTGGSSSSLPR